MSKSYKKVLLLGAGLVSAPCVEYLTQHSILVTIASAIQKELDNLVQKFNGTTSVLVNISDDPAMVEKLVSDHDLTISLLPYSFHPQVAEMCIRHRKCMVNASYQSHALKEMNQRAKDADVTILSEVGLDPGIDHFLAMKCIDKTEAMGGKVVSFESWCGGLPAPQFADNPLRYKFSWSPKASLETIGRGAKWLECRQVREIPDGGALLLNTREVDFSSEFQLEGFPNRDSIAYKDIYGLRHVETVLRGTLRLKGFCDAAKALIHLGLTNPSEKKSLDIESPPITWRQLMCEILAADKNISSDALKSQLLEFFDGDVNQLNCIEGLGLMSSEQIEKKGNCLDTLSHYLGQCLAYRKNEFDMTVMKHVIGVADVDNKKSTHTIDLLVYGDEKGYSAMAKTVGYPVGIAATMILEGQIKHKGVILPLTSDIYLPVLEELKSLNIIPKEHVEHL